MNNEISKSAVIKEDVIIGDDVYIGDNVVIEQHCVIRNHVHIGNNTKIGIGCILGEILSDYYDNEDDNPLLSIGENSLIRSYSILYGGTTIGNDFQTGHRVTIREFSNIGEHTKIGTLSDVQGYCDIGNYVNAHSNVHVGQKSIIEDYVWLFPYVILTNDPTPPSFDLKGVTVKKFAVVSTGSILLPGVVVGSDALVGAGAIVTKDVEEETIVVGNPAHSLGSVRKIKNHVTGEQAYPWRYQFDRGMPWANIGYDTYSTTLNKNE